MYSFQNLQHSTVAIQGHRQMGDLYLVNLKAKLIEMALHRRHRVLRLVKAMVKSIAKVPRLQRQDLHLVTVKAKSIAKAKSPLIKVQSTCVIEMKSMKARNTILLPPPGKTCCLPPRARPVKGRNIC